MLVGDSVSVSVSVLEDCICLDKWEVILISVFFVLLGVWKEVMLIKRKLVFIREVY